MITSFKAFLAEEDYKGQHEAPDSTSGDPMHHVTKSVYPEDFYSHRGFDYYGQHGETYDRESYDTVVSKKYHPGGTVRIYRAIPKEVKGGAGAINKGDWVTINKKYAHDHGKNALNGNYKIAEKTVHPRDLFTDGNSIHEWGYDPQPYNSEEELHYKNLRRGITEETDEMSTFHNWVNHTKSFRPEPRSFTGKNGKTYTMTVEPAGRGSIYYKVHHKRQEVGSFYIRSKGMREISIMNAGVDDFHQRQGIASHVYRAAENDSKHTGMSLVPQGWNNGETSDDAKALWRSLKPDLYGKLK